MIRKANISDVGKIVSILSSAYTEEELEGAYLYLSQKVRDVVNMTIYIDESNSVCLFLERAGNFKAQVHLYAAKSARGPYVKTMCKEIYKKIVEDTDYTSLLAFSPSRLTSIYVRSIGFKSLGTLEDAGGPGVNEELFYATMGDIKDKLKIGEE